MMLMLSMMDTMTKLRTSILTPIIPFAVQIPPMALEMMNGSYNARFLWVEQLTEQLEFHH